MLSIQVAVRRLLHFLAMDTLRPAAMLAMAGIAAPSSASGVGCSTYGHQVAHLLHFHDVDDCSGVRIPVVHLLHMARLLRGRALALLRPERLCL